MGIYFIGIHKIGLKCDNWTTLVHNKKKELKGRAHDLKNQDASRIQLKDSICFQ
jgi:hypothetical protein